MSISSAWFLLLGECGGIHRESSIFLEGHLKDASNEALMEPWKAQTGVKLSSAPQVSSISQKSLQKRAQHTHHVKEKATLSSLGQKGDKCLQIISFVLLHWCCSRQLQFVCETIGARWADCWARVTLGKLLEHPPPLFSTLPVHFRLEIERPPPPLGSGQIHRKLLSWLDSHWAEGSTFHLSFQPTHPITPLRPSQGATANKLAHPHPLWAITVESSG